MWLLRRSLVVLGKQSVITVQSPHMPNGPGLSASGCRPMTEEHTLSSSRSPSSRWGLRWDGNGCQPHTVRTNYGNQF